jgi:hypothetical protein
MAKVVEFRSFEPNVGMEAITRFVWTGNGPVQVVPLRPGGDRIWKNPEWGDRIPGPEGRWLTLDDGELFLEYMSWNYRGSSLWATPVFELPDNEALQPRPTHLDRP